jgi:hypothetical protein
MLGVKLIDFMCVVDQGYHEVLELYDLSKDPNEERNLARNRQFNNKLEELQSWIISLIIEMVIHIFDRIFLAQNQWDCPNRILS